MSARTVKVRIAVAACVDDAGNIVALECDRDEDGREMEWLRQWMWEQSSYSNAECFVTFDFPIPELVEVEGVVKGCTMTTPGRLHPDDGWQPFGPSMEIRAKRAPVAGALFSENYELRRAVDDDVTTYEQRVRRRVARQEGEG